MEVSAAVRHIYTSLGFKRFMYSQFMMHGHKNIKDKYSHKQDHCIFRRENEAMLFLSK